MSPTVSVVESRTRIASSRARRALEANLWSQWSQFGRGPGCTLHDKDGALWFETPIPILPYNMVIRFERHAREADAVIDGIFAHFGARGIPFLWVMHPSARPFDLPERLIARGFDEVEPITGMAADLSDLPADLPVPGGVEIHDVTPEHDFVPFMQNVASRWHVPESEHDHLMAIGKSNRIGAPGSPNRAWIALKDGVAVAKAVTHDSNDCVGLYGMATQPEARGLGLGRLLCIKALSEARKRGHDLAVLHSTPMARPLYESVGFHALSPFSLYAAPHSFYA